MSLEAGIFDALKGLVSNRVYPDVARADTPRPYITWQQVGGAAVNFLECVPPGRRNARVQVNCWDSTRIAAAALARAVEDALVSAPALRAYVVGAMAASHEPDLTPPLYGTMQDFSIWT